MIKWSGEGKNGKTIGLGLTRENVERLKAGEPISVNAGDLGIEGVMIVIHYGDTEAAIVSDLRKLGVAAPLQRRDVEENRG